MSKTTFTISDDKKTLIVERVFPAPKSLVWDAYSKPDILASWWGPKGWETQIRHFDFSVGGYWHYCMRCIDKNQGEYYGMESWGKGTYTDIVPLTSISYKDEFCDESAKVNPDMPVSHTYLKLVDENGNTRLISKTGYETEAALKQVLEMGMEEGYRQTLDNLEACLVKNYSS